MGDRPAAGAGAGVAIVAVILLLFMLAAVFGAQRKDVTQGFDEVAHLSYAAEMQRGTGIWPALENLRMLDPQTFRFTGEANYLNHPPFYYALLARLGPAIENNPGAVLIHRFLNIVIVAAGLAAAMTVGLFAGFDRLRLYAYCVPLACIPVLAPLAGAVNPDNAAFAGGAVATLAAWQLVSTGRTAWLLAALAGALVASWAKLTGLLLTGGLLAGIFLYLMWRGRFRRQWIIPIALAAMLVPAPYAAFVAQYGSPTPNTPAQIALLETGARATGWADAARLSFPAYGIHFLSDFVAGWMPALAPRNPLNYAALVLPVAALLCAVAGFGVSIRRLARGKESAIDIVAVAGLLAIAATLACNILFSYDRHLSSGWMMDAYPRYYLPLAAVVPLAGLSLLSAVEQPRWRAALIVLFIAGPLVFRLFGGPLGL
ncbi:MAG: hypothetical protein WD073_10565 [Xanthobacteraceae bacterium]